jgi:transcriptional regulator
VYRPPAFDVDSRSEIRDLLRRVAFGHLVTNVSGNGPSLFSTPLPFVVDDTLSEVRAHFARANPHWRQIDGTEALLIAAGSDAYVSPRWYPSKAEHCKVVPTWNYEVVHLHGTIEIHDDHSWKHRLVSELTEHNESRVKDSERPEAWAVSDAPAEFVDQQLRGIVGVQLTVSSVEAKRKLSQNRPTGDRDGVIEGLGRSTELRDIATAVAMHSSRERLEPDA